MIPSVYTDGVRFCRRHDGRDEALQAAPSTARTRNALLLQADPIRTVLPALKVHSSQRPAHRQHAAQVPIGIKTAMISDFGLAVVFPDEDSFSAKREEAVARRPSNGAGTR